MGAGRGGGSRRQRGFRRPWQVELVSQRLPAYDDCARVLAASSTALGHERNACETRGRGTGQGPVGNVGASSAPADGCSSAASFEVVMDMYWRRGPCCLVRATARSPCPPRRPASSRPLPPAVSSPPGAQAEERNHPLAPLGPAAAGAADATPFTPAALGRDRLALVNGRGLARTGPGVWPSGGGGGGGGGGGPYGTSSELGDDRRGTSDRPPSGIHDACELISSARASLMDDAGTRPPWPPRACAGGGKLARRDGGGTTTAEGRGAKVPSSKGAEP